MLPWKSFMTSNMRHYSLPVPNDAWWTSYNKCEPPINSSEIITSIEINKGEIQFKYETFGITLEAIADCCSSSYLFLPRQFNKNDYLSKVFDKIEETESEDIEYINYDYSDLKGIEKRQFKQFNNCIKNVEYIVYFTDKTYFYILLKNYSNGYYSGWLSLIIENLPLLKLLDSNKALHSTNKLIVVVGLPASGKTTYCKQKYPKYKLYDDYLSDIYNNQLLNQLTNNTLNSKVIINDPRLCNITIFQQQIEYFLKYIPLRNIQFILYDNRPDQCILNSQLRNDDKDIGLKDQILTYSQNYSPLSMKRYMKYLYKKSNMNTSSMLLEILKPFRK